MSAVRILSLIVFAIVSACSSDNKGGSASTATGGDAGTAGDGGVLLDGGTQLACTPAPAGSCSGGGAYCGVGCCEPGGGKYACAATGRCYLTLADATAACGASCIACTSADGGSGGSCTPTETCTCPMGSGPSACLSLLKCYSTVPEALAACGTSCVTCTGGNGGGSPDGGTGGTCSEASSGTCSVASMLYCGSIGCCNQPYPYACAATQRCYATHEEAVAACSSACVHCR